MSLQSPTKCRAMRPPAVYPLYGETGMPLDHIAVRPHSDIHTETIPLLGLHTSMIPLVI